MAKTYSYGIEGLKEFTNMLQRKATSDQEHIKATISSQAIAIKKVVWKK